ncbi:MAG: ATP-binding protein [Janthinobacterium lividum]
MSQNTLSQPSPADDRGKSFSPPPAMPMPSPGEFEHILKRLVDRIGKILQAEKCVFLLHDVNASLLYAAPPALGFTREELLSMERPVAEDGVSNEVFRTTTSSITFDAVRDPRAAAEGLARFGIHNAVSVPLIVEKRDEDNRVLDRTTVGVLHVFNKKYGGVFADEDVRLLEQLARQGAAVIASAQMYREVVQEKQELLHTIDSLYAGLLMVGNNGRLVQINPSARAILGISPNSPVIDVPFERAIADARVRAILARALSSGHAEVADEVSFAIADVAPEAQFQERIYQVQCATVRDDDDAPAGIVAIFNDITEIRGVEQMKTAFISTVSHELRTPLTSIKGFISTLLTDEEGYFDEATRREFYGIIDSECDRLKRLIEDLLDISRIEQGSAMQLNWQQVDVVAVTERVLAAQRSYAKNHILEFEFPADFPLIDADLDKIDQILTNLVNNAIKYSPHGGMVRVSGSVADGQGHRPSSVILRISDEGMGISREHLSKIFENFYRVDNRDNREIGGTGIGLALVKALVEGHQGTVTPESELGKGTTFTVVLPIRHVDQHAAS